MKSKRLHEGELLIDHRNSPGVSEEFIRASGLDMPAVGAGQTYESATITCAHCQSIVVLNPNRSRERGWCRKCDAYMCDLCAALKTCRPFKQLVDEIYDQQSALTLRKDS